MWSKVTTNYLVWSLESASRFYACPYNWNRKSGRVEMKSKVGQWIWAVNFLLEVLFEMFVICRTLEMHVRDVGSAKDRISMKYTTTAYLIPIFFELATCVRWDEFPLFVNSAIKISDEFKRDNCTGTSIAPRPKKWYKKATPPTVDFGIKNRCDPYIRYIFYIGRLVLTLQSISIFTRPSQRFLLTSLWPNPKEISWAIRLPIAAFHLQMVWSLCFKMQLYTFTTLAHLSPTNLMLQTVRSGYTRKSDQAVQAFLRFYNQVQLQHSFYQRNFGRVELPFTKGDLIAVATLSIYGAIKLSGLRAAILTIIAAATTVTMKIVYQSIADLNLWSSEALRSWRFVANSKLAKLKLKAARPLRTRIGTLYIVPKSVVPIIMFIILDNTITLLLTF